MAPDPLPLRTNQNSNAGEIEIPTGFQFAACGCGIKASGKLDLSMLVADRECVTHGAFTQNLVRASCVEWNETRVGTSRALVVNSGNANACTGEQGQLDTSEMARQLADLLGCATDQVLVMSTGIIGELMPMPNVRTGIDSAYRALDASRANIDDFAKGILTTDSFTKICSRKFESEQGSFSILGIAKGAGMIGPNMAGRPSATMLCALLTDFPLAANSETNSANQKTYQANAIRFQEIIELTFNSISVDGHTSTSDQVILFAPPNEDGSNEQDVDLFFQHLTELCEDLARMIPSDGEGATHLIEIEVRGEYPEDQLRSVAKTIADSLLVKTAVFGADPNWGRIVSAAGYNGLKFETNEVSLRVNGFLLFEQGMPVKFDAAEVSRSMKEHFETHICLDLSSQSSGQSHNCAKYWTSDLTYDYVKINAEYHT